MNDPFPAYEHVPLTSQSADVVAQLGDYGEILEDGHDRGLFGVTPTTEDTRPLDDVRRRTMAMQLWLLGYLDEKPTERRDHGPSQTAFRTALRQFRDEAGLPPRPGAADTIDDDTWYALNELVTFEGMEGTDLTEARIREKWMVDGVPRPSLRRAVQLRLFVLGLHEKRPGPTPPSASGDLLEPFLWVNQLFRLDEVPLPQGYFPKTIATLFKQDRFVELLSEAVAEDGFRIRRPESLAPSRARELAQSFIVNVAKVELWLLGFDVRLDGETDYPVSGFGGHGSRSDLQAALSEYWQHLEETAPRTARRRAESITPALFESLQRTSAEAQATATDPEGRRDYSREVVEEHLTTEQEIAQAWAEVQDRRLSLWDGLKRVWGWIKRGVKTVVSWVGSFFKNVARAFYRYASKGYKIVRLAVTAVVDSVEYFVEGTLSSRPDGRIVLFNQKDFDASLYVDKEEGAEHLSRFLRRIRRKTAAFAVGARVLGIAFQTIRHVALGIGGWPRLLISLVHSLRDLKPHYEELKALRAAHQ